MQQQYWNFSKLLESREQTCKSYGMEISGFDLSFSNINITGITLVTTQMYAYLALELCYSPMYQGPIHPRESFYSDVWQLLNAAEESTI